MTAVPASNTRLYRCSWKIYQFNAIAEGIVRVAAPHPGNILGFDYFNAGGSQLCNQTVVVRAFERGMRFLCRQKICFHPQMNLYWTALKPTASPL
jgi:hypothetical protein